MPSTLSNYMSAMYLNESRKSSSVQLSWINDLMDSDSGRSKDYIDQEYILNSVEGMPYQFLPNVDRRINGSSDELGQVGRKFSEKIVTQMPILFAMPCKPRFMPDADNEAKSPILNDLISGNDNGGLQLFEGCSRYYSAQFAYNDYYTYLNSMLTAVLHYMTYTDDKRNKQRLSDMEVNFHDGQGVKPLGKRNWRHASEHFKKYFTQENMLAFYIDGLSTIDNTFSNTTTPSSLASQVNGYSDQVNELRFLFGKQTGSAIGAAIEGTADITTSLTSKLTELTGGVTGGVLESLMNSSRDMVLQGGKISFPEIWSNSEYNESYSISMKLRSPDNDPLSIFLNVIKPYCEWLCLTLPHNSTGVGGGAYDPNSYISPFLIKAFCKSLFNIDLGIITNLQATRGAECQWSDDGLPTQIDLNIEITNLYSQLSMPSFDSIDDYKNIFSNTYYLDFLGNMVGCNIMEEHFVTNKVSTLADMLKGNVDRIPSTLYGGLQQAVYRKIGNIFNL